MPNNPKSKKLFVGNLSFSVNNEQLTALFSQIGPVVEVTIIKERETERPRGFAFVTMQTVESAEEAIKALHGKEFEGRDLVIDFARPRQPRLNRY